MKVTVSRKGLLDALAAVGGVPAARTTKPALQMVRADLAGGVLTLAATDGEVSARFAVAGAAGDEGGACLLPPEKLAEVLRATGEDTVTFDAGPERTKIRTAAGLYSLPAADPNEFPAFDPPADDAAHYLVPAGVLRSLHARTVWAADKKESSTRWNSAGVLIELAGKAVNMAGTDTRKLAFATAPAEPVGDPGDMSGVVPLKAMGAAVRVLGDDAEPVRVTVTKSAALFVTARACVRATLSEGKFPPYRQIMPKSSEHKFEAHPQALLSAVRAAALTCDRESQRVDFRFGADKVTLSARSERSGESEVELPLPGFACDVAVSLDPSYLDGWLKTVETPVTWEMTAGDKPVVLRTEGTTLLAMPMVD